MTNDTGRRGKIVDEQEVLKWFEEGRTYPWMVEQYREKYHLQVGHSMFGNFRRRHGLPLRQVRDENLLPWDIRPEHRYAWTALCLRIEAKRRSGAELTEKQTKQLDGWLRGLKDDDCVVHYDPNTKQGWWFVPREKGDDDIIRRPKVGKNVKKNGATPE